jgi:hypothetical protein
MREHAALPQRATLAEAHAHALSAAHHHAPAPSEPDRLDNGGGAFSDGFDGLNETRERRPDSDRDGSASHRSARSHIGAARDRTRDAAARHARAVAAVQRAFYPIRDGARPPEAGGSRMAESLYALHEHLDPAHRDGHHHEAMSRLLPGTDGGPGAPSLPNASSDDISARHLAAMAAVHASLPASATAAARREAAVRLAQRHREFAHTTSATLEDAHVSACAAAHDRIPDGATEETRLAHHSAMHRAHAQFYATDPALRSAQWREAHAQSLRELQVLAAAHGAHEEATGWRALERVGGAGDDSSGSTGAEDDGLGSHPGAERRDNPGVPKS